MRYHEIENAAFELYNGSSSRKQEWIDEYIDYKNGETCTVWNDEFFTDWSEDEKKERMFKYHFEII